ncbi:MULTISPECIES: pyrroline-5-carboxylate reductase dimerization domain-containing protein [unclassified Sedimentibacter]|uniref:pyrroline-5-carboxylate reductase dimerization domain-containing protein n=1 Tax=unclassified Sedimentibacter TaxID=2649220 RepID=UPI0027DF8269|nr:pyrroline-5-carboxylate reductase dimerization domain-containing protein [Sedimentibacter sp. MB35-C1]WMJ75720.1 pyrroline-5-carboxylate reductase dimerization domain-containing protein [Sedimentibacter sp. MB35-C1]
MKKNIGIIGIGNVGSMMLRKFIELNLFKEENIYAANRSEEKLESLRKKYPSLNICKSNIELAQNCSNILLCVEPLNLPKVLLEIQPYLNKETYLMVSTSMVAHKDIYNFHKGGITIFMPTLISMVNGGVTLTFHNKLVKDDKRIFFESIIGSFSEVKIIGEEDINLAQNMTASFPGFFAEIMLEFVKAASKKSTNLSNDELEHMLLVSLLGASRLLLEKNMSFEETIHRVSTKGGITYEGVKVFEEKLPEVFDAALNASTKRYDEITKLAAESINGLTNGCNQCSKAV